MKYLFCLFFSAYCLLLTSCSGPGDHPAPVSEEQRKEIESAVINRFNAMIMYAEAGELENILMHFEPSGPGSYIEGGTRYAALQDMMLNHRATWKVRKQDYGIPVTKVHVLSPDYALVTSSSTLNTTTRENVVFQPRPWSVTTLWMLKDGQWFIHSFHQYEGEAKPVDQDQPVKK